MMQVVFAIHAQQVTTETQRFDWDDDGVDGAVYGGDDDAYNRQEMMIMRVERGKLIVIFCN